MPNAASTTRHANGNQERQPESRVQDTTTKKVEYAQDIASFGSATSDSKA